MNVVYIDILSSHICLCLCVFVVVHAADGMHTTENDLFNLIN